MNESLRLECSIFDKDMAVARAPGAHGGLAPKCLIIRGPPNHRLIAIVPGQSTQTVQLKFKQIVKDFTRPSPLVGF